MGLTEWPAKIQGLEVNRYVTQTGMERLQAPALNFFALMTQFAGQRDEYTDINIRKQLDALFVPPPGETVEERPELGGTIANLSDVEGAVLLERVRPH